MKISEGLQGQLDRLSRTGSFGVSILLKKELKELTIKIGCTELVNMDCGTCVRRAMHDVNAYMKRVDSKPVLQMKMVKSAPEMTYKEMRRFAKDKGHRLKNPTKKQLIKIISNEI
jgi:hypothetical protein